MAYLIILLFFYQYLRLTVRTKSLLSKNVDIWHNSLWLSPVILVWVLFIGGQYNVGTDYFSYLYIFNGGNLYYLLGKGDVGFVRIVEFLNSYGIHGQSIFFIFSFIWIIILCYAGRTFTENRYLYLFIFIFVTFSSMFHNQMNVIRQYCAVYLFTLGVCLFYRQHKFWSLLPFLSMLTIHSSSIVMLVLFPVIGYLGYRIEKRRFLYIFLIVAIIFSVSFPADLLERIVGHFTQYETYMERGDDVGFAETVNIFNKITKYVNIPIIVYAIYLFPKMNLTKVNKTLFIVGVCGFCFKLALVDVNIVRRMGAYFEILMCVPILYLLIFLKERGSWKLAFIMLYLLLPYVVKVTFAAKGEYLYNSIFFR